MTEKVKTSEDAKKSRKDSAEELGEVSYTYWKRDSDIKADHKGFQPQAVSTNPQPIPQNQNQIGSAWNKAGTWEEKKVTKKQLENFFNEYISKNKKEYKDTFKMEEFSNYSGDAYFIFSRGKIKFLYDCSLKLKISGIKNFENLSTTVTINEINNQDEDEHFQYEYNSTDSNSSSKKYPLIQNFKSIKDEIEKDIRKIFDELKASFLNK